MTQGIAYGEETGDFFVGSAVGSAADGAIVRGTVNAGADTIRAGRGNDTINEAGDGARDTIDCGKGTDTVTADSNDRVARNCETVNGP